MKVHDINTTTLSDVTNKGRTQSLTTSDSVKNLPNTNNINFDKDVVNIKHAEYSNADNYIKRLDIGDNKQVHIIFSKNDCKMSVRLVAEDGQSTIIPRENCPTELAKITTIDVLDKFLENAYVKVSTLSDGVPKLYISQKCLGGMLGGSNQYAMSPVVKGVLGSGIIGVAVSPIMPSISEIKSIVNPPVKIDTNNYGGTHFA